MLRYSPTPLGDRATAGSAPLYRLGPIELALLDVTVWELLRDIEMLAGLMAELPTDLPRRALILRALERMMDAMDPRDVAGTAAAGRAELAGVLASPANASAHHLHAVGHAHIDSAWLWPVRETVRKCARTFSTVLDLMDEHADFVFACSSAQQFAWIKQYYPELFARIRAKVAAGQFVPVGGMWVEADTNMPGGEAMARQFVAGQAILPRGVRGRLRRGLAARFVRLFGRAAADRRGRRGPVFPHPEDLLEPDQPDAASHLLVAGHRRHPGVHPFPAGRHLQLHVWCRPNWRTPNGTTPSTAAARCRWCRSGSATAAADRPGR